MRMTPYTWDENTKLYLKLLIEYANGSLTDMAKIAGLGRATIYRMIDCHDLRDDVKRARESRRVTRDTEIRRQRRAIERKKLDRSLPTGRRVDAV